MNVLLASSSSGSRGGGEIYLQYLGRALAQRGHDVTLWCSSHSRMDELAATFREFGRVVRAPYRNTYAYRTRLLRPALSPILPRRIAGQWAEIEPDIIHVNKQNLEDGLDLIRAATHVQTPALATIHITQSGSFLNAQFAGLRDVLSRWVLKRFEGPYVAVQERRREELSAFLDGGHDVRAVNNGVPLPDQDSFSGDSLAIRKKYGISKGTLLVVGVGRLEPQKRPHRFLEVAEKIYAKVPNARFLWVGDGPMRAGWEESVEKNDLADIVQCVGWQEDVNPFLAAADAFLHVAEFEGLPLALIEAMAAELPCMIPQSLLDDFEVLGDQHVLVVDDEESLPKALREPSGMEAVAQRGRRLVEEKLSVEHMAQQYETLYREARQE